MWRDLRSICGRLLFDSWFDKNIVWRLSRDDKIQFSNDRLVGQNILKDSYLKLYDNGLNKGL